MRADAHNRTQRDEYVHLQLILLRLEVNYRMKLHTENITLQTRCRPNGT